MGSDEPSINAMIALGIFFFFFFKREFQPMMFALDDSFLSSDQDTNQFLG